MQRTNTIRELNRQARDSFSRKKRQNLFLMTSLVEKVLRDGGPVDKGRRKFVQGMGILACTYLCIGKYYKTCNEPAAETAGILSLQKELKLGLRKTYDS